MPFAWIVAARSLQAADRVKHLDPDLNPESSALPSNSCRLGSMQLIAGKHFKARQPRTFSLQTFLPRHCCDSVISREVRFNEALSCLRSNRSSASLNVRSLLGVSTTHGRSFRCHQVVGDIKCLKYPRWSLITRNILAFVVSAMEIYSTIII